MVDRLDGARVLIYSHDTFGLGHLRRCRTIAHALVEQFKSLTVLILSGSPIIGSFDFRARVDFVRIPGVIKLRSGDYTSLGLHIDLEQTLEIRASIIEHTAEVFRPDVFIVDKEPLGLRGEVERTLEIVKSAGTFNVLGLRDILDEPERLNEEWERKNVLPALTRLYDQIWVYGDKRMGNPLEGIALPDSVKEKMRYMGYLKREVPESLAADPQIPIDGSYLLVTAGGGGDGESLIDWVLTTYEQGYELRWPALMVFGPFMASQTREQFEQRAARLPQVETMTFESNLEILMKNACAVVAMGGYNTFCEILSLDKRALIVPRTVPREEQLLRAQRASDLGLVRMLTEAQASQPAVMAEHINALENLQFPSRTMDDGFLGGLDNIVDTTRELMRG